MRYAVFRDVIYPVEKETPRYVWVNTHRWLKEDNQRNATRRNLELNGKTYSDLCIKLIDECDLKREQERLDANIVIKYLRQLSGGYSNNETRKKHSDAQLVEVGRILGILNQDDSK